MRNAITVIDIEKNEKILYEDIVLFFLDVLQKKNVFFFENPPTIDS